MTLPTSLRRATPVVLTVSFVVLLGFSARAADLAPDGASPFPFSTVSSLATTDLAARYQRYRFEGVSREEAEILFAESVAALYLPEWDEMWLLTRPELRGSFSNRPGTGRQAAVTAAPWRAAEELQETSLEGFLTDVALGFPGLEQGTWGEYLLMTPRRAKADARVAAALEAPAHATGTVVNEGFEADPWSRWKRTDDSKGAYMWEVTNCSSHSGSAAADAVRGGTSGSILSCLGTYPVSLSTWMVDTQCENLTGAGQAWLDFWLDLNSESGYDGLGVYFEGDDEYFYGTGFTGNSGGWFHLSFNLRQWYTLGDLTGRSCNSMALIFDSDNTITTGFGARVDDIRIQTDASPSPSCTAAANPPSGPAPLTVSFTGSVSGALSPTYSWSFDDGGNSALQNPTHTFSAPGDYDVRFRVTDLGDYCYSWVRVTATSGGGGVQPQAGTYKGTTSQGRPIEFDVDGSARLTRWKVDFECGASSGSMQTTSASGCPVTNGSFSCGSDSCPTVGGAAKVMGTFNAATSASGTFNLASRPTPSSSCCTLTGVSWSATLQSGTPLSASASASPTSGTAPLTVNFTGSASGGTAPYSYSWNFDDGSTSTAQNPSHTYTSAGTYTATLTVSDAAAATTSPEGHALAAATSSVTITVNSGGPPLSASASALPTSGSAPLTVGFSGAASGGTPPYSYSWNFDDGTLSSTQQSPSHTYANPGTYQAVLTVTDSTSATATATVSVTVTPPVQSLSASASATPSSGAAPLAVSFTGAASGGTAPYSYSWNFNDGSAASSSQNPSHTFASAGTYQVTLTVTDAVSATATASVTVSVQASATYLYLIPAAAHNPGLEGTLWRTDVGAVCPAGQAADLTLTLRSSSGTTTRTIHLDAGSTVEWTNILETVFDVAPGASVSGSIQIESTQPLSVTSRTFNQGAAGTFGQYLPALTEADALSGGQTGYLPQLKKNSDFRTNIGAINLGSGSATVAVKLFDEDGAQIGSSRTMTLQPGQWKQESDIFVLAGAGEHDVAYATVEVQGSGKVWVYASVIDAHTGDPTTVPVLLPPGAGGAGTNGFPSATGDGGDCIEPTSLVTSPWLTVDEADVPPAMANQYAGYYYGTTSQNLPVNIHVTDSGMVDYLSLRLKVSACNFTCTANTIASKVFALSGNRLDQTLTFPLSTITTRVQGSFSSSSAGSGTYSGYSGSFTLLCGSSLCWSSGGALSAGTWTVARETASPLTAAATASATNGPVPLSVSFTGSASGGTPNYTYRWDFGDGYYSSSQNPTHTYKKAGAMTATLYVWDSHNWAATSSVAITTTAPALSATASGSPTSGPAPLSVSFTGSGVGGVSPFTYKWNFGDDSSTSSSQNPSHTYTAEGTYEAQLEVTDSASQKATATVSITVTPPPPITVNASADVTSGTAPLAVNFSGSASGGAAPYSYSWDFDDGSPASTQQNPSHTYQGAGEYTATLTVSESGGASATAVVTISVAVPAFNFRALVPAIAHNPGTGGTLWRTDVAAVNPGTQWASFTLKFTNNQGTLTRTASLAPAAAVEWGNLVETVFGVDPATSTSGSLEIYSDRPLVLAARTYNATPSGTFGQYLPALYLTHGLAPGQQGVLPQLKKGTDYRTNIGAINLSSAQCNVRVKLYDANGVQVGSTRTLTVPAGQWKQESDIFATSGAGDQAIACAIIEVEPSECRAWVYGSVVDAHTGDPTTIPVLRR